MVTAMGQYIKQIIFLAGILYLPFQSVTPQYVSNNNYTGAWETPSTWKPEWAKPITTFLNGYTITINGHITVNGHLTFSGTASNVTINDTLIIKGDMVLENNTQITVNDNGILIVMGNLSISNQSVVIANGNLVVANNLVKTGAYIQGLVTSNDNPVKLFVAGTVSPDLTGNNLNYPALNCSAPGTNTYPGTSCCYGNFTDLKNDPNYSFFQKICSRSNTSTDISVCVNNTLNLTSANGTSFNWSGPGGFTSALQNPSIPNANASIAGNYIITITAGPGCADKDTINVTVNALPVVSAGSNSPVCLGSSINLTASDGIAFSWGGPRGFTSTLQNPVINDAGMSMSGTYTVTVTASTGCKASNTTNVIIGEKPFADAGPDQTLKFTFKTQLNASLLPQETGEWTIISGKGQLSDIHSPTSSVTGLSSGENKFLWTIRKGGCIATDEIRITVEDLFIPSVITPDGDGKNDVFKINAIIGRTGLIILNRWGNVEYSDDNYSNNWNGKNNKGETLPGDTYFYILTFENGLIRKGTVLITR